MQWITLAIADLQAAKAAQLIAAVQGNALATGQADPIPVLLSQVIEEIRGAIGYSGKYQVSTTASTIPPNLKDMAVQKAVRICKRRLEQMLSSEEATDETSYQSRLKDLIRGAWPVDAPDDPLTANPSTPLGRVSTITTNARQYSVSQLSNL